MLKVDLHTHNVNSLDGLSTLQEMALEASRKKLKILGITPHGPSPDFLTMPEDAYEVFQRVPKTIAGVRIVMGAELNVGHEDYYLRRPSSWKYLKVRAAGIHTPIRENTKEATDAVLKAIKDPRIHFITHPYYRNSADIEKIADAAVRHNKLLEVNNSNFKYNMSKDPNLLERAKKMIDIIQAAEHKVIINSDAHISFDIGEDEHILKHKELGLREKDIINNDPEAVTEYFGID